MTNEELLEALADELEENRGLVSNPILVSKTIRLTLLYNKGKDAIDRAARENIEDEVFGALADKPAVPT